MSDTTTTACPTPRCPRCGAPLRRSSAPASAFGVAGEACFECDDASPVRQSPWACPGCGGVWLLDPPTRE